jgi:hypothetical protein
MLACIGPNQKSTTRWTLKASRYVSDCTLVRPETDGGVQTVRRDNCRLVQTVIETCLHKMLIDRDVKGAEEYVFSARQFYALSIDCSSR